MEPATISVFQYYSSRISFECQKMTRCTTARTNNLFQIMSQSKQLEADNENCQLFFCTLNINILLQERHQNRKLERSFELFWILLIDQTCFRMSNIYLSQEAYISSWYRSKITHNSMTIEVTYIGAFLGHFVFKDSGRVTPNRQMELHV